MVRVPTYASYMNLLNRSMQTKSLIDLYSFQATTGIKYANYSGYGMTASNIVNMEAAMTVTQNFKDNNVILDTTIKAMSTVMERVEDTVSSVKSHLNNAMSALTTLENGKPVGQEAASSVAEIQALAFSAMSFLSDALNTSVAGKYIFGAGSSVAPTQFKFDTLEQFQKYYDGLNIQYPSDTNANLSSRNVSAVSAGDLTITHEDGQADNEFVLAAANGFSSKTITGGEKTTGNLNFSAVDNTLKASVRGAFNTIGAGDTMLFTDENGVSKAYIVDSVSADGKTITFSEETPVEADMTYTNGIGDNGTAIDISTSFAVGTVVNFAGSSDVAPALQIVGIRDNGDLVVRADESYFGTMPVTVPATNRWTMSSNSYYVGGSATETFRVSDNQRITLDVNANDSAFEKLFSAFGVLAQGNMIQTDEDGNVTNADEVNALVTKAMDLLQSAVDNNGKAFNGQNDTISLIIAKISANHVTLDNVGQTLDAVYKNLEESVYLIKNVDKTEATAKMMEAQNSLQASYQTLTSALNLSLLNYLD